MYGYGAQVLRNKIHGLENASPDGGGAYGIDIPIPVTIDTMYIMNNIIYDIRTTNYSATNYNQNPFGIRILGSWRLKLWYNSVNLYGSQVPVGNSGSLSAAIAFIAPIYYELDMKNNVFSNTLEGLEGSRSYAIWAWAFMDILDTLITSIDYNDYYAGGTYGILGNIGAPVDATNNACDPINNKYTIEEWQAATLQDTNSLAVDPMFIANDNLMPLFGSPIIGEGLFIEEVPFDFQGIPRSNPTTIGAYEVLGGITLLTPENGAENISITPLFTWETLAGYSTYNLQIASDNEFETIVLEQNGITETSYQIEEPLISNLPFYWRIQAVTAGGAASSWSEAWSFTTQLWSVIENTGNSATIIVPSAIQPMIGNRPIANGDVVGLFYEAEPGVWQCAGYGVWAGSNLGIIVWGNNPDTPEIDGYIVGQPFNFVVYDAIEKETLQAYATFELGPDNYQISGFSMLASLSTNQTEELNINLGLGWNCISSYIEPEDDDVEIMLASIENNVKLMKNSNGQMYVPEYNINTIGNWDISRAYLINMINANILTISGTKITPELTPINLNIGWNLSAYLRDNGMSVITALASITPSLVLAKNNAGGIYSPVYGINTLGNMVPTQGYYFYMNAAAQLTYPANSAMKSNLNETTPNAKYLIPSFNNTGNNATLLLSIENNDGNEIGVYNQNKELVGSGAIYNGIAAITIWGDDESTSNIDGAIIDENLLVKILNTANNTTDALSLTNINDITSNSENQSLIYKSNAIYSAKAILGTGINNTLTISNSPNPVESNTKFEFNLTQDGNTQINIYNVNGEIVASIVNHFNAGMHNINFDASNLADGVYNVVLHSGNQSVSTLMIVGK